MDQRLNDLTDLAYNLWWSWNQNAQSVFRELSPQIWEESNHNAVAVLHGTSHQELRARLNDSHFREKVDRVITQFRSYMRHENTWGSHHAQTFRDKPVAYFSPEFALHECLPIYSGGLGVLSGDHIKSASDLDIPFVGVGLFYRQGYFQQHIAIDGTQQELYPLNDTTHLPLSLLSDRTGKPVVTVVEIGHSLVSLYCWQVKVGRAQLYLLDSNHPDNEEHYRELTSRTYGGDIMTRICQEIVMGIGGVRLLRSIGIRPSVYHMNEGHSAFLTLELLRERMLEGQPMDTARAWVREHCVFTTHTP
ncbi:MAG TPA: alpha-glucan family phosphorylase, partial [bacterium]|nr:alpha-glucan family phosphorylase [bacterium]